MPAPLVAAALRQLGPHALVGTVNGPDYAARAAAGAEFLDGQVPGWAGRVELAVLALHDHCKCVLGQLGGDYFDMRDDLHLSPADTERLGFSLSAGGSWPGWAELDAAWAREIVTRREAATVTT
jgi:hypothetical protein